MHADCYGYVYVCFVKLLLPSQAFLYGDVSIKFVRHNMPSIIRSYTTQWSSYPPSRSSRQ